MDCLAFAGDVTFHSGFSFANDYSSLGIGTPGRAAEMVRFLKIKKNFKLIELPEKINKNLVDLNKCFSTLSEIDKVDGMFAARIKKYD